MKLKWNREDDTFILDRDTICDLFEFNVSWYSQPKSRQPWGYKKFHKEVLRPLSSLLVKTSFILSKDEEP